ncbi:MAG: Flp pilus assembly protein CpaB [Elusimicrobiales bacterium]|nr:Flp pilus assembly protein CpaB [Elusimicrobiales bacterium]
MEKKGMLIPLALAVGAAMIYWMVLTSRENQMRQSYVTATVITAATDLPPRTVLKEDLIAQVEVPKKFMQQDAYQINSPTDLKQVVNLVTAVRIPKGNQITMSALMELSPEAGLSVKVPPGYRGAVLGVDQEIIKLVKPGDRVDLLVTFEAVMNDGRKEKVTATMLQNVLVLGVGANLGQGMDARLAKQQQNKEAETAAFSDKGVISLALNPSEVQYLALMQKSGDVSLAVRGLGDTEMHPMEMASFAKLFRTK